MHDNDSTHRTGWPEALVKITGLLILGLFFWLVAGAPGLS
jgi:hypothetical protein